MEMRDAMLPYSLVPLPKIIRRSGVNPFSGKPRPGETRVLGALVRGSPQYQYSASSPSLAPPGTTPRKVSRSI
jgi:hypothetical protein